jgi:DNA-binding FrmR family transcriptional regulator
MKKYSVKKRLSIISGQISGLIKIIDSKDDCRRTVEQFNAISMAIKNATMLYLQENLDSCLKIINLQEREAIDFILSEIIKKK